MDVFVAKYINDRRGWFVISADLLDDYNESREYETAEAYRCFCCGIIVKTGNVVVHNDSCNVGSDERLNESLFMLEFLFDNSKANDGIGPRVETDINRFISKYRFLPCNKSRH